MDEEENVNLSAAGRGSRTRWLFISAWFYADRALCQGQDARRHKSGSKYVWKWIIMTKILSKSLTSSSSNV